jgi:hypothetical protein
LTLPLRPRPKPASLDFAQQAKQCERENEQTTTKAEQKGESSVTSRIPEEVKRIIAMMRTGEMRAALSQLEDDAAAGDEEAEQLRQQIFDFLDWVKALSEGQDPGEFEIERVKALFKRLH